MVYIKEDRNVDIDAMKGIGIILVVAGHMIWPFPINKLIYSFHMPLFVCLSGIVFNAEKIKKNVISLLYLYFLWGLIVVSLYTLCYTHSITKFFEQILHLLLGGSANNFVIEHSAAFWYLTCILIVELMFCFVCRMKWNQLVVSLIAVVIGIMLFSVKEYTSIPYNIDVAFFLYPYFSLGNEYGSRIMKYHEQKRPDARDALFVMILLFICVSISNGDVNVFRGRYGNSVLLYYVQGILGTFLVYFITMFLPKKVKRILIWLGQNTVFILVTHQFLLYNIYVRYAPPIGNGIKEHITITCISIFMFALIMCIEVVSIFVIKKYTPFLLSYKYLKKDRKDKVHVSIKGEK